MPRARASRPSLRRALRLALATALLCLTGVLPAVADDGQAPSFADGAPRLEVTAGAYVHEAFPVAGYPAPTVAVTGALPPGLAFEGGVLSGTPTAVGTFTFTLTATNDHGTASAEVTVDVRPGQPAAPIDLIATPGAGKAHVRFIPPDDNGSPVTGYEVRVGEGAWQPLTTTADGAARRGTVTGLTNGREVYIAVRAVNAVGAGDASAYVPVTPSAPPVAPLPAPTAVEGISSVTVSWQASTAEDVTGYTVLSSGSARCDVGPEVTSCVVGVEVGASITFRVVVHTAWGDSEPSPPSAPVAGMPPTFPQAPPSLGGVTTMLVESVLGSIVPNTGVWLTGGGFLPNSTVAVGIYSEPRLLAMTTADAGGNIRVAITVPGDLPLGRHTLVAIGVDHSGQTRVVSAPITVVAPGEMLAATGVPPAPLVAVSLLLVLAGVGALRASHRMARSSRA